MSESLQHVYRRRQRILGLVIEAVNIGGKTRYDCDWVLRTLTGEDITDQHFKTQDEAMKWPWTFKGLDHIRSLIEM